MHKDSEEEKAEREEKGRLLYIRVGEWSPNNRLFSKMNFRKITQSEDDLGIQGELIKSQCLLTL